MVRVLSLIILIWLIYWVLSRLIKSYWLNKSKPDENQAVQTDAKRSNLKIVQCSRCGCHVPESESHLNNDQVICNANQCNEK